MRQGSPIFGSMGLRCLNRQPWHRSRRVARARRWFSPTCALSTSHSGSGALSAFHARKVLRSHLGTRRFFVGGGWKARNNADCILHSDYLTVVKGHNLALHVSVTRHRTHSRKLNGAASLIWRCHSPRGGGRQAYLQRSMYLHAGEVRQHGPAVSFHVGGCFQQPRRRSQIVRDIRPSTASVSQLRSARHVQALPLSRPAT